MRMSLLANSLGPGKVIAHSLYISLISVTNKEPVLFCYLFPFFLFGGGWGKEEVICSSLQIKNLMLTMLAARFSRVLY